MGKDAWQNFGLAALVGVTLASVVWLLAGWPPQPPPFDAAPVRFHPQATAPRMQTLAVVGDSYSAGSGEGGLEDAGWPAILSVRFDMPLTMEAVGGTGYVAGQDEHVSFGNQAHRLVRSGGADVVVVFGSRNDAIYSTEQVRSASTHTLRYLHRSLPTSQIVVVGPSWPAGLPPEGDPQATRGAVRSAARRLSLPFVDPVAEHWLSQRLTGSDDVHPTNAGHARFARLLGRDLHRLGVL